MEGTKAAAHYVLTVPSGEKHIIRCRLSVCEDRAPLPLGEKAFDDAVSLRKGEADEFYKTVIPGEKNLKAICDGYISIHALYFFPRRKA